MAAMAGLHVQPHFNAEEAAATASEFVGSLDNLQGEVCFLLEEIHEKDARINSLVQRISTRHHALTKSAKSLMPSTAPLAGTFTLPIGAGELLPTEHLSTKDAQNITKIQAEWQKVETLQEEKIRLAERLERIVNRARERGRAEWERVGGMDMDEIEKEEGKVQLGELGGGEVLLPPGGLGGLQKKKRPNALPVALGGLSLGAHVSHPPSAHMPPPAVPTSRSGGHARSGRPGRHDRQISTSTMSELLSEPDGENDGPEADGDADADDTLYCFCQQRSYGEMIGCDNEACEYEWFHVKCVDMVGPLPDTWYCPDCVTKLGLSSSDGKPAGRGDKKGRRK